MHAREDAGGHCNGLLRIRKGREKCLPRAKTTETSLSQKGKSDTGKSIPPVFIVAGKQNKRQRQAAEQYRSGKQIRRDKKACHSAGQNQPAAQKPDQSGPFCIFFSHFRCVPTDKRIPAEKIDGDSEIKKQRAEEYCNYLKYHTVSFRHGNIGLRTQKIIGPTAHPRGGEAVQAHRQPVRPASGAPPVPAPGAAEKVEWLYQGKNVEESQAPKRAGAMRSKEKARCAQGCH